MNINIDEIKAAGLDPKKIASIARRIEKAALEAQKMGVQIFGGSTAGTLRFSDNECSGALILANMEGDWNGGDGAYGFIDFCDGLIRGEI